MGSKKLWMRKVTGVTFVKPCFVRPPPQYERFIRPRSLRLIHANVTHVESGRTFLANILNVEMNPYGPLNKLLGKIDLGTIIRVKILNTNPTHSFIDSLPSFNYAQVTNNPSHDGTINSVLISK